MNGQLFCFLRTAIQWLVACIGGLALGHVHAQDELWVLSEAPPSLGVIDMVTFDHEELITFSDAGFATDLEIRGDEAIVVLENRVVKVDLLSGQILADTELIGAQEAALLEDGTVVVTRGGVDDAWQPLELTSHLVWLDGDDLGLEGELLPTEGPTLPSQEITVVDGKVYIAVNNGWAWGQEAGRLGCWDVEEDTYSEWDLGEGAENPVALHVFEGDVFTVNNGDWTSTSVSRVAMADMSAVETVVLENVSAGCNASTFVDSKLAIQISGEHGLRVLNPSAMDWEEEVLNAGDSTAYSLIAHPEYGWTCAGVTDYVTYGEVQIRTSGGDFLATVPVGVSPGTLAWRSTEVSSIDHPRDMHKLEDVRGSWDVLGRAGEVAVPGMPALRLERTDDGSVRKVIRIQH